MSHLCKHRTPEKELGVNFSHQLILRPKGGSLLSTVTATRTRPFPPLTCSSIERCGWENSPPRLHMKLPFSFRLILLPPTFLPIHIGPLFLHPHSWCFPLFFSSLSLFLVPFFVFVLSLCICYLYFSSAGEGELSARRRPRNRIPGS